jgi:hypothetical protein
MLSTASTCLACVLTTLRHQLSSYLGFPVLSSHSLASDSSFIQASSSASSAERRAVIHRTHLITSNLPRPTPIYGTTKLSTSGEHSLE